MFQYTLKRKKIKNIILKIDHMGEILVSAPLKTAKIDIENFLLLNKEWIEDRKKNLSLKYLSFSPLKNDFYYLLGSPYNLPPETPIDLHEKIKFFSNFYKRKSLELLPPLIEKYLNLTGLNAEHITFRTMKTRWGSCNSNKKYLNFNSILVASSTESIEYVVLHEIAHLKFPNHKKEFWDFISEYMPDWATRKKNLIFFEL